MLEITKHNFESCIHSFHLDHKEMYIKVDHKEKYHIKIEN